MMVAVRAVRAMRAKRRAVRTGSIGSVVLAAVVGVAAVAAVGVARVGILIGVRAVMVGVVARRPVNPLKLAHLRVSKPVYDAAKDEEPQNRLEPSDFAPKELRILVRPLPPA